MFNKKPRRNFRQRRGDSSDEEEQRDQRTAAAAGKKPKAAPSRGISCSSKREETPPKADRSDVEAAEKLELTGRENNSAVLSFSQDREALEPEFRLKKSSDKAVLFQVRRKEAAPADTAHSSVPNQVGGGISPSASPRQDYGNHASPQRIHHDDASDDEDEDDEDDKSGSWSPSSSSDSNCSAAKPVVIPDAQQIDAARRQRRAAQAKKDFISLQKDGHSSAVSMMDHCSEEEEEQQQQEEEEEDEDRVDHDDDEPDDHERRIKFAPRIKTIRERITEKLEAGDDSLSGSEEEELELWEETQILKGVKRQAGKQSPSCSESSSCNSRRRQKKKLAGDRISETPTSITVSMVKRRISGKLDSLKQVYRAHQAKLSTMEGDVENARTSAEILEENSSEKQLQFYRAMTLFTHNLVACLQEKVVEINLLELDLHSLLSDHQEVLTAQKRQRIKEQAEHLHQLSYGSDKLRGTETRGETDAAFTAEEDSNLPADTQLTAEEEGQLHKQKAEILLRSQSVFSDVQDEFCDVKKILCRFAEWRAAYSDSYHSAYISLCLPKLLNPIIRHQLLAWSPLEDPSRDLEDLPWFSAAETFCYGHEDLDQTDRQTLPTLIEKSVLPKISAFVELVWDPLSLHQAVCLTDICHRLRDDYSIFEEEQSKTVKALIQAVVGRLRNCVDEDVFIPLYPKELIDRSSPHSCFRNQQLWSAIKLLGNMGKWDLLLPESVLKELMLDKLLNRYLMITLDSPTLSSKNIHTCKKIAESLPLSWFTGHNECLSQLQSFRNHLVQSVHSSCKQQPEDPDTRATVVEVLQILSRIRCHDSILAIAEKYHYQDVVYSQQLLNPETG